MKNLLMITLSFLTVSLSALSQNKGNWLSQKIHKADTVLLVSHEATAGVEIVDKDTGESFPPPKLIIAGKPNYSIIKEQRIVTGLQLDRLIKILNRPFRDKVLVQGKCFMPHHALFLIKNREISYIDVCFDCGNFETSADLSKIEEFDDRRWTELKNFFLGFGVTYELNKDY